MTLPQGLPSARDRGLVFAAPWSGTEGDARKLSPLTRSLSSSVLCCRKCDNTLAMRTTWPVQQEQLSPALGRHFLRLRFHQGRQVCLNNKVVTLTSVHLAKFFIATCARMHLCIAKVNCLRSILAITRWPASDTNLTHNI